MDPSGVAFRTCTILVVALAVFAGGSLGTANGMALHLDDDGHLALEVPHLAHAFSHAEGADHEPHHHHHGDSDHVALHHLIAACADSAIATGTLDRSSPGWAVLHGCDVAPDLCLPECLCTNPNPAPVTGGLGAPAFRGGTARLELAALRCIILLV